MGIPNRELRTSTLWKMLCKASSADSFIMEHGKEIDLLSFHAYIRALCEERGEAPDRVIRRADIEKSFGHSLFRGSRRPSRDTVLQLAFGFRANLDLAQELLKHAGHSPLYPRVRRDVVISHCLMQGMSFQETQIMLSDKTLPPIGGAKR